MNPDTKVTISGGGQTTSTTMGQINDLAEKLANKGKIKEIEDLLQIHNDKQTTADLNRDWKKLRSEVDSRASLDETKVKGELTIKIIYEADSDTGKKEIEIKHDLKLPAPRSNKRTMYETADGELSDRKPTKQTEMFPDNVKPIRKGV